jgi:hypothetical protein
MVIYMNSGNISGGKCGCTEKVHQAGSQTKQLVEKGKHLYFPTVLTRGIVFRGTLLTYAELFKSVVFF